MQNFYLHSERFVADMVKALQLKAIDEFKISIDLDALLIDDIQFFAGKERFRRNFFILIMLCLRVVSR